MATESRQTGSRRPCDDRLVPVTGQVVGAMRESIWRTGEMSEMKSNCGAEPADRALRIPGEVS